MEVITSICLYRALPFVVALLQLWQRYLDWSAPYRGRYSAAKGAFDAWWEVRTERYQDFISDETKRKWRWRRLHEGEFEFWKQVVYGTYAITMTFCWQLLTPHTLLLSLLPPLWVAWSVYPNMFINPIGFALLLMMPMKFVPGTYWRIL
ncbi:hypothetical protein WJX81_002408 [Elliptochloris bilobata]|uniref:Glycosyl-4,4'-diaponeurosporenoate acyltransferase n=1 Tax=Elliptochloris bilobata TaxID=381761 RepID=A0AAW1RPQ1_9CHLO